MLLRCRKRLQVAISRRMNEEGRDTLERLRLSPEDAENGQSNEPDLFVCFFSFVRLDLLCQVTVSSLHKTANNLRDSSYHNYFFFVVVVMLCYVYDRETATFKRRSRTDRSRRKYGDQTSRKTFDDSAKCTNYLRTPNQEFENAVTSRAFKLFFGKLTFPPTNQLVNPDSRETVSVTTAQ